VHAEIDVIEAYFRELARALSPDGVAFIHHSNLGEYKGAALSLSGAVWKHVHKWPLALKALGRLQVTNWDHWRGRSVTARKVAEVGAAAGLVCIGQEIINWGRHNRRTVDCLSLLTRRGSRWEKPNVIVRNPYFMAEARSARIISEIYMRHDPEPEKTT
jgi:hypothetical protein